MPFPAPPSFTTSTPEDAWWRQLVTRVVCSSIGIGVITALQIVLRNALRPPWTSYNGTHTTRPTVDGNWGPGTNEALWTYLGMRGMSSERGILQVEATQKHISIATTRLGIWAAYYTKRHVDLDAGGTRVQRDDPAVLGEIPLEQIQLPDDTTPPKWLQRPFIPTDLEALGSKAPTCRPEVSGGTLGTGGGVPEPGKIPAPPKPPVPAPPAPPAPPQSSGSGSGGLWALGLLAAGGLAIAASKKKRRSR